MKKVVTISISIPENLVKQLDTIAEDTQVSRSAVATGILSVSLKWIDVKEVLTNAK